MINLRLKMRILNFIWLQTIWMKSLTKVIINLGFALEMLLLNNNILQKKSWFTYRLLHTDFYL